MRRYDLIMFDLDGTLVDTAPEICDAVNDTLQRFDMPNATLEQVAYWIGHGTNELLLQAVSNASGTPPPVVRSSASFSVIQGEYTANYARRCGTRSQLFPSVRETLAALRASGVKLALVTNKERMYSERVLHHHHLDEAFDMKIFGDSLPTKKPDPAGIYACLKYFNVSTERALFVGDSSIDIATARNAQVTVWALPYGYNMGQSIAACNPDCIIDDCSELLKTVNT